MSSTNRRAVRQTDDFYVTPGWVTRSILPRLSLSGRILEPGCGDGAIARELIVAGAAPDRIHGVEIDEGRAFKCLESTRINMHRGDFKSFSTWAQQPGGYSLAIGNPPFSLAMDFIETSRALATTVCFLLRLNFLGSQDRAAWHRSNPSDVFILPKRPGFVEHLRWSAERGEERCPLLVQTKSDKPPRCALAVGHLTDCMTIGTDSSEYGWFVWGPCRGGHWTILEVSK